LVLIFSIGLILVLAMYLLIDGRETRFSIGAGLSFVVIVTATVILTGWIVRTRASVRDALQQNQLISAQLKAMANRLNLASAKLEEAQATHIPLTTRFRHDLIGPLGSISGFLELLRDGRHGELNARQLIYVQNIELSVGTLFRVAEQIAEQTSASMAQHKLAAKALEELVQEPDNPEEQLSRV